MSQPLPDYVLKAFETAFQAAAEAAESDEVPVGAVIVKNTEIIAIERNRIVEYADPTAHAELLAIQKASAALGNERLTGCELFTTLEPCVMCSGAIIHARLPTVWYLARDDKLPALRQVLALKNHNHYCSLNHTPLAQFDSAALLRRFFKQKRQASKNMKEAKKNSNYR